MSTPPAFQSQDAPKPLPFDPSKLKGLSEQMIRSHWENNYGGSVKAIAELARAIGTPPPDTVLVGIHTGGVWVGTFLKVLTSKMQGSFMTVLIRLSGL